MNTVFNTMKFFSIILAWVLVFSSQAAEVIRPALTSNDVVAIGNALGWGSGGGGGSGDTNFIRSTNGVGFNGITNRGPGPIFTPYLISTNARFYGSITGNTAYITTILLGGADVANSITAVQSSNITAAANIAANTASILLKAPLTNATMSALTNIDTFTAAFVLAQNATANRVAVFGASGLLTNGPATAAQLTNIVGTSEPITNSLAVISNLVVTVQAQANAIAASQTIISNLQVAISNNTFAVKGILVGTNGPNLMAVTNNNNQFASYIPTPPYLGTNSLFYSINSGSRLAVQSMMDFISSGATVLTLGNGQGGILEIGNGGQSGSANRLVVNVDVDVDRTANSISSAFKFTGRAVSSSGGISGQAPFASYFDNHSTTISSTNWLVSFAAVPWGDGTYPFAAAFMGSNTFALNRYNLHFPTTASNVFGGDFVLDTNNASGYGFAGIAGHTNYAQVARFYWSNSKQRLMAGDGNRTGGVRDFESSNNFAKAFSGDTNDVVTITAGAGAGTSPTVSVIGSKTAGIISITAGVAPSVGAVIATVTWTTTMPGATNAIVLWPHNAAANALGILPHAVGGPTQFTVNSAAAVGLVAATTYEYQFINLATGY